MAERQNSRRSLAAFRVRQRFYVPGRCVDRVSEPIRVLVVEDEALVRIVISDHLRDDGFDILEAANANEAIVLLETHADIQILFTDIDMPGSMDGLELSAIARHRWPLVRIVIASGQGLLDIVDLPEGGLFYSKPYDHDLLARSFREMMRA